MANPGRAEVEATGADGAVYRFRLGTGALCVLEETLDLDVMALFEKLQQGKIRLGMVREFVKAAYVSSNGDGALTNPGAEDVIDNVGVIPVLNAMSDSILLTFNLKTKKNDVEEPTAAVPGKKRGRPAGSGISKSAAN